MLSGDRRVHIRFVVVCSRSESISQSHIVGCSFYSHSSLSLPLCCLSLALQVIIFLYGFNTWASITRNIQLTHHRPSIQVFCRRHNRIMFYCSNTSSRKVKCYTLTRHYCSYMVFGLLCHHDGAMHTVHTYSTETFLCPTIRWHWLPSSWLLVQCVDDKTSIFSSPTSIATFFCYHKIMYNFHVSLMVNCFDTFGISHSTE